MSGRDQRLVDGELLIDAVSLEAPGYVVVYGDGDGAPGGQLGASELLEAGDHTDIAVEVDETALTSTVFVMVHLEDSDNEALDYPDGDPPASGDAGVSVIRFEVNT